MPYKNQLKFDKPNPADGPKVHQLIAASPNLDLNSLYCYLLQCSHFSDTSVCLRQNERVIGFASGYIRPDKPKSLFIWQIVVDRQHRKMGLANKMIESLIERPELKNIESIEATITKDNKASWSLFENLAKRLKAPFDSELYFDSQRHFSGEHKSEHLIKIGPLGLKERKL